MLGRTYALLGIAASIGLGLFFSLPLGQNNFANAEKCKDIKHEDEPLKWDSTGHGDNEPSESKFNKWIFGDKDGEGQKSACEVAKGVDHMKLEGEIKENEYDEFKETIVYVGTSEEVNECFDERFELPDDNGNPELQAYELKDCQLGNY